MTSLDPKTAIAINNILGSAALVEILQLKIGLRSACRFVSSISRENQIRDLVLKLGLSYIRSEFCVKQGSLFAHTSSFHLNAKKKDSAVYYYIGVNELMVKLAYFTEGINPGRQGSLFGYPACCINFFQLNFTERSKDLTYQVGRPANKYSFWNNRTTKVFGYCLISHFPCSWDCRETEKISRETFRHLLKIVPELAKKCIMLQKQNVFYSTKHTFLSNADHIMEAGRPDGDFRADTAKIVSGKVHSLKKGRLILMKKYIYLPFAP